MTHRYNLDVQARIWDAMQRQASARSNGERLTTQEIGHRVGRLLREEPIAPAMVQEWISGAEPTTLRHLYALAAALEVDPGWLAFGGTDGNRSGPPPPPLSPEELAELQAKKDEDL